MSLLLKKIKQCVMFWKLYCNFLFQLFLETTGASAWLILLLKAFLDSCDLILSIICLDRAFVKDLIFILLIDSKDLFVVT